MDITSIITAIIGSGIVTAILGIIQNKRINRATAAATEKSSAADYTDRIIKQADDRVTQVITDRDRLQRERDEAYIEVKGQRKAKQEWRDRFFAEQDEKHAVQLALKDTEAQLQEEKWYRCEAVACRKREPPRNEAQIDKKMLINNNTP